MSETRPPLWDRRLGAPDLPVMAADLPRLLAALADDDMDVREIAALVELSPAIAARLVRLANSVWLAPVRPITSVRGACAVLGLRLVRSVSVALAAAKPFNASRCPGFDIERFWSSTLLTAEGAALLSPHAGDGCDADTLRTAGLFHNLGLLWMAAEWPVQTASAFQAIANVPDGNLADALRAATGTDHCELGGLLGEAWRLPEPLTVAMRHHRSAEYQGPHWRVAAGCGVAASMSAALRHGMGQLPDDTSVHGLDFPPSAVESVFGELTTRSESTHELARAAFG